MVISATEQMEAEKGNVECYGWWFHDLISSPQQSIIFPIIKMRFREVKSLSPKAHSSQAKSELWKNTGTHHALFAVHLLSASRRKQKEHQTLFQFQELKIWKAGKLTQVSGDLTKQYSGVYALLGADIKRAIACGTC